MKQKVSIFLICLAGLILRLFSLGKPELWFDELLTLQRSGFSFGHLLQLLATKQFPPLYYLLIIVWSKVFGVSATALRLPSVIFSTLSIFFIYKLAKEMYGRKAGLLSALLLCVSAYSINYAQEAKMYSMVWFFGTASFLFFYRFVKEGRRRDLASYVVATTLSIYTMYIGFLYILVQNACFIVLRKRIKAKAWFSGQLAILALYLPWIYRVIVHFMETYHHPFPEVVFYKGNIFFHIYHLLRTVSGFSIGGITFIDQIIFFLLAAFALVNTVGGKHRGFRLYLKKEELILLAWIIFPLAVLTLIHVLVFKIFRIRYTGFMHIPLIILFSRGFCKLNARSLIKYALLVALVLFTYYAHLYPYYKSGKRIVNENWGQTFERFSALKDDHSLIVALNIEDFMVRYFIKDSRAKILMDIDKKEEALLYNKIFIVYRNYATSEAGFKARRIVQQLPGYRLIEKDDTKKFGLCYYWLEKKIN